MRARGSCGSTSAPRPASARPTRCSTRATAAADRGTDVVVGFVETHGRPHTAEQLGRARGRSRAARSPTAAPTFTEMDLRRGPAPARPRSRWSTSWPTPTCPGREHDKRWQDIEELLDAGIDVISTVNVQHLESLNDVVEEITGVPQRETVPDAVVRAAEQVELVDMTPEALRRRMAHGNIYKPDKVDAALGNYFRVGNLTALRELALLWLADRVDEGLQRYREQHGIAAHLGDPRTRRRRAHRRPRGRDADPPRRPDRRPRHRRRPARRARRPQRRPGRVERRRRWPGSGCWSSPSAAATTRSSATTSPTALLDFARGDNATQIVLGASRRNPLVAALTGPGTGMTITRVVRARSTCTSSATTTSARAACCPELSQRPDHAAPAGRAASPRPSCSALLTPDLRRCCATSSAWPATCCCSCSSVVIVSLVGGF